MEGPGLTPREEQVLDLIRRGYSNRGIADELGISLATSRYHVSEIISKLGVGSREEAARWRTKRILGLVSPVPALKPPSWEVIVKTTTAALLAGSVLILALVVGGIVVMQSRSGNEASATDAENSLSIRALELDVELEVIVIPAEPRFILRSADGSLLWPQDSTKVGVYDFDLIRQSVFSPAGLHNMVIVADPGTNSAPGLFQYLPSLSPGQSIELTLARRSVEYTVVAVCQVPREAGALMLYGTPAEALTLITQQPNPEDGYFYVKAERESGSLSVTCPEGDPYGLASAADLADRIRIPIIGLDSILEVQQVDAAGTMPSPDNSRGLAIYDFAAASNNLGFPAGSTNVVIAGYRGTFDRPGPFYRLDSLLPGDYVVLLHGGESKLYPIAITCEVPVENIGPVVASTSLASLTLVTDHPSDPEKRLYVRAGSVPATCPAGDPYIPSEEED
jgi:DNA-binding CsgD family transcriptional regulator/sortase (surface protein transpeptidase)